MQQYGQEMKQQNAGNGKLAKEIDEMMRQMEQTETDLVNKTITQQTIRRQQQILSRLLEHEKAEMQREKEQRRESHEAADQKQTTPPSLEQYKKLQKANKELFHSSPASLKPFYKSKVNDYFFIAHWYFLLKLIFLISFFFVPLYLSYQFDYYVRNHCYSV